MASEKIINFIKTNDLEQLLSYINSGENINIEDEYGRNILQRAIVEKKEETANFLIKMGINIWHKSASKRTALSYAVQHGLITTTKILLILTHDSKSFLAIINEQDCYKKNLLHYACENKQFDIIDLLLKFNIDTFIIDKDNKRPFDYLSDKEKKIIKHDINCDLHIKEIFEATKTNNPSLLTKFVNKEKFVNFNNVNILGIAPLHYACLVNNIEFIERLIKLGADINQRLPNFYNYTPAMIAIHLNREEILTSLYRHAKNIGKQLNLNIKDIDNWGIKEQIYYKYLASSYNEDNSINIINFIKNLHIIEEEEKNLFLSKNLIDFVHERGIDLLKNKIFKAEVYRPYKISHLNDIITTNDIDYNILIINALSSAIENIINNYISNTSNEVNNINSIFKTLFVAIKNSNFINNLSNNLKDVGLQNTIKTFLSWGKLKTFEDMKTEVKAIFQKINSTNFEIKTLINEDQYLILNNLVTDNIRNRSFNSDDLYDYLDNKKHRNLIIDKFIEDVKSIFIDQNVISPIQNKFSKTWINNKKHISLPFVDSGYSYQFNVYLKNNNYKTTNNLNISLAKLATTIDFNKFITDFLADNNEIIIINKITWYICALLENGLIDKESESSYLVKSLFFTDIYPLSECEKNMLLNYLKEYYFNDISLIFNYIENFLKSNLYNQFCIELFHQSRHYAKEYDLLKNNSIFKIENASQFLASIKLIENWQFRYYKSNMNSDIVSLKIRKNDILELIDKRIFKLNPVKTFRNLQFQSGVVTNFLSLTNSGKRSERICFMGKMKFAEGKHHFVPYLDYQAIYNEMLELKKSFLYETKSDLKDSCLSEIILYIYNGYNINNFFNLNNIKISNNLKTHFADVILAITALLLGVEYSRDPSALILNLLAIDLIKKNNMTWEDALIRYNNQEGKFGGGLLPCTIKYKIKSKTKEVTATEAMFRTKRRFNSSMSGKKLDYSNYSTSLSNAILDSYSPGHHPVIIKTPIEVELEERKKLIINKWILQENLGHKNLFIQKFNIYLSLLKFTQLDKLILIDNAAEREAYELFIYARISNRVFEQYKINAPIDKKIIDMIVPMKYLRKEQRESIKSYAANKNIQSNNSFLSKNEFIVKIGLFFKYPFTREISNIEDKKIDSKPRK